MKVRETDSLKKTTGRRRARILKNKQGSGLVEAMVSLLLIALAAAVFYEGYRFSTQLFYRSVDQIEQNENLIAAYYEREEDSVGQPGSPIQPVDGNIRMTITSPDGTKTFDLSDGEIRMYRITGDGGVLYYWDK